MNSNRYRGIGRIVGVLMVIAMASTLGFNPAWAENYPTKQVEMVAWASPGGGSDIMCRAFSKAAEGIIPQPLFVVNKKGGGGAVGMAYVQGRPADGYTLLGITNNLLYTPLSNKDFQFSYKDFVPIIMWGYDPKCIAVAANSPYKTIEDLVAAAKATPGKVKIGTFGPGTDDHVTGYMLGKTAGVQLGFVPFDSGGEILAALLGGHIGAQVTEVAEVKSQMDAGKVRILAVATEKRIAALPDVPTLTEKGFKVVVPKFRGLAVKKGTPQPVVDYLIANSLKAVNTPEFQKYQKDSYVEPAFLTGKDFEKLLQDQEKEIAPIMKELGF
jgi:putative tricarboxylic transport membrane protein